jgi:hypothetical protein
MSDGCSVILGDRYWPESKRGTVTVYSTRSKMPAPCMGISHFQAPLIRIK